MGPQSISTIGLVDSEESHHTHTKDIFCVRRPFDKRQTRRVATKTHSVYTKVVARHCVRESIGVSRRPCVEELRYRDGDRVPSDLRKTRSGKLPSALQDGIDTV